jgi:hypothetical protein
MPMRKTTEARTAFGRYSSGRVRKSSTISTTPAVVRQVSWVRPPALSAICVFVGLPLTTNVPDRPAPRFAMPSPTMSTFSSKCSWYRAA